MARKPSDDRQSLVYSTEPTPAAAQAPSASPAKPGPKTAKLSLDRKGRGGKSVTIVSELGLPEAELEELGRTLRRACGTGGTVKEGRVEVQGDHRDTIEARLTALGWRVRRSGG